MARRQYGKERGERYPAGHPLGGRFKPKAKSAFVSPKSTRPGFSANSSPSLPPTNFPIRQLEDLASEKKGFRESLSRKMAENRIQTQLSNSIVGNDPMGAAMWQKNVAVPEFPQIVRAVARHVSIMEETQRATRPHVINKLRKYEYSFSDFGNFPAEAIVDHEAKVVHLNKSLFLERGSPMAKTGDVLSTLTHEYAHMVDHALTDNMGEAGLTGMFEPLHNHLTKYAKGGNTPKWLWDSGIAYPLNGYFGATGRDGLYSELGKEYVSTLSELYWMAPDYLDKLDEKFKKDGYKGPPMREMMQRTWGNVNITKPLNETKAFPKKIDEEMLPISSILGRKDVSYTNKWEPGVSDKDWRSHITFDRALGGHSG